MKLTFRKHEVKDLSQLLALVAENAEAVEPGFRVLSTTVNFGRSMVELVGLDRQGTPALIALGFTGDDTMLFRIVEAYAWSLEYPESVRRLMPDGDVAVGWPPRVVFIAERLPESLLRKIRLLAFPAVNCFEFRCVEVNDAMGFYLDPVDWAGTEPAHASTIPADAAADLDGLRREAGTTAPRAAEEPHEPAVGEYAHPSRWFGLRPPETRPSPAVTRPRERAAQPAPPADDARLGDDHELTPAWRKFLEKLAGTFDTHLTEHAPAAEKPAGPPPERAPTTAHAALLDVVKLPPNGELVPQWRKFLEKAPLEAAKVATFLERPALDTAKMEMFPETVSLDAAKIGKFSEKPLGDDRHAKVAAVREYLNREFPMCTIYDFHDHQRNAQVVQLQDSQGKVSNLAAISVEFLEAHGEAELHAVLDKLGLAAAMRQAGQAGVAVTRDGLEVQKR